MPKKRPKDPGRGIKELIANALASVYWDDLLGYLRTRDGKDRSDFEIAAELAKTLDLDRVTPLRWFKGKNFVHPGKFFLVVAALMVPLDKIEFNGHREALRKAKRKMIERLRRDHLDRDSDSRLSAAGLACVRLLHSDPEWKILLRRNARKPDSRKKNELLNKVLETINREFYPLDWNVTDVARVSDDWLVYYDMFIISIPYEWEFFHEA